MPSVFFFAYLSKKILDFLTEAQHVRSRYEQNLVVKSYHTRIG